MTRQLLVASVVLLLATAARADVTGIWLTEESDAHIEFAPCGSALCGTIVWLKDPLDANGRPLTDVNNRDPAQQSRPLLGVPVALWFQPSAVEPGKLVGYFYNADDGNYYEGKISEMSAQELVIEGCIGAFCHTQVWTRVK